VIAQHLLTLAYRAGGRTPVAVISESSKVHRREDTLSAKTVTVGLKIGADV
jgi:hypothetical protein